ncbi:MAG TPA: nuclear transport factor 2 family protein [Holophagaceae bacterium]|nr:nuclear transport factor 2 family protein [Holophagaceae bacterium]
MRVHVLLLSAALAIAPLAAQTPDTELRAVFDRFVAAQNAHDLVAVEGLLADSPSFLWITKGTVVTTRAEALKRFEALYKGTWRLDPDMAQFRVVASDHGMAQLFVPVTFTIGAPGQAAQKTRFLMNQVLLKGPGGWRITGLLPIPASAP